MVRPWVGWSDAISGSGRSPWFEDEMTFKAMGSTPDRGARLILYDGHAPIGRGVQCSRRCYKLSGVIKVDESALFALIMKII